MRETVNVYVFVQAMIQPYSPAAMRDRVQWGWPAATVEQLDVVRQLMGSSMVIDSQYAA